MDPELLRLLLEIFGSQGEAGNGSPDSSPYVPPLTNYLDSYYNAIETPTPNDAAATQNVGGASDGQQIGGRTPVPQLVTDGSFFTPIPFSGLMATTDWNAQPSATGHIGPQAFEDGSSFPGEPDPAKVPQMISGQFQQFPSSGIPRPAPVYLNQLQAALQQAHANGGRQPRDLFVAHSGEPYFDEYDQAFAPHRDPINQPAPLAGLFGSTEKPKDKKVRAQTTPQQAAQQITRQAQAAQPQRQYSTPALTYTPASASRSAAQTTFANTLNTLRSLARR